jgi:hypothetical protein
MKGWEEKRTEARQTAAEAEATLGKPSAPPLKPKRWRRTPSVAPPRLKRNTKPP